MVPSCNNANTYLDPLQGTIVTMASKVLDFKISKTIESNSVIPYSPSLTIKSLLKILGNWSATTESNLKIYIFSKGSVKYKDSL